MKNDIFTIGEGFDRTEKNKENSWNWAIKQEACICFPNETESRIYNIKFYLCPPPGKQSNFVTIYIDEKKVMRIKTPQECNISFEVCKANCKTIKFESDEELTYIDTGDTRGFAFQLVDFKCVVEEMYQEKESLNRLHQIQKNILRFFIKLCDENGLIYYMFYGSLLGVVRHDGIIPWDDDIDVVMPRKDLEKFLKIIKKAGSLQYSIEDIDNGDDCYYGGYVKLVDNMTTKIVLENWNHKCHNAVGIDIFPLDYIPEDSRKRNHILKEITKNQELLFAKVYGKNRYDYARLNKEKWKNVKIKSLFYSKSMILNRLKKLIIDSNKERSFFVTVLGRYLPKDSRIFYAEDNFGKGLIFKYDNLDVRVPENYLKCLETLYGSNYMLYPPREARVPKSWALWDFDRPFEFYQNKIISTVQLKKKVQYVLWGLSDRMKYLLDNYSMVYDFVYIVVADEKLSGKMLFGLMMISENIFQCLYTKGWHILLCSDSISEDVDKMERMNIDYYSIFVEDAEKVMCLV